MLRYPGACQGLYLQGRPLEVFPLRQKTSRDRKIKLYISRFWPDDDEVTRSQFKHLADDIAAKGLFGLEGRLRRLKGSSDGQDRTCRDTPGFAVD